MVIDHGVALINASARRRPYRLPPRGRSCKGCVSIQPSLPSRWDRAGSPTASHRQGQHSGERPHVVHFRDFVAGIISETADIPRDQITPESHAIDDLGIDSLAFLDIAFAIDKAFGIKLPLEQWTQEVNEGKAPAEDISYSKTSARISTRW